jgi:hypothetical protein
VKDNIWKFELESDRFFDINRYITNPRDVIFYDVIKDRKIKAGYIKGGLLCIKKGYQWDGCTPKFMFFNKIIGVPDFKKTKDAALVHDFLIDFFDQHKLTRKQVDTIFCKMLKEKKFKLKPLYCNVVNLYRLIFFKERI